MTACTDSISYTTDAINDNEIENIPQWHVFSIAMKAARSFDGKGEKGKRGKGEKGYAFLLTISFHRLRVPGGGWKSKFHNPQSKMGGWVGFPNSEFRIPNSDYSSSLPEYLFIMSRMAKTRIPPCCHFDSSNRIGG